MVDAARQPRTSTTLDAPGLSPEPQPQPDRRRRQSAASRSSGMGDIADLVGLPDLARDALAALDRSHLAGESPAASPQPAVRPGLPAGECGSRANVSQFLPDMTGDVPEHPSALQRRSFMRQPHPDGFFPTRHRCFRPRRPLDPELGRRPDHDGRAQLRHQGLRQQPGRLRRPGLGRRPAADRPAVAAESGRASRPRDYPVSGGQLRSGEWLRRPGVCVRQRQACST